jgi:hypothetical protein
MAEAEQDGASAPPAPPAQASEGGAGPDDMCRICFEGEAESGEALIAPCGCRGSAAFVHLSCLRRWQRMVLVQQPTHPDLWRRDVRNERCSSCLAPFSCAPPSRGELMASFTGPEIAALCAEGCAIAASDAFSATLSEQLRELPPQVAALASLRHWHRGAYLIVHTEQDRGTLEMSVSAGQKAAFLAENRWIDNRWIELQGERWELDPPAQAPSQAQTDSGGTSKLVLRREGGASSSNDHIAAVNLTRPMARMVLEQAPEQDVLLLPEDERASARERGHAQRALRAVRAEAAHVAARLPAASQVQVTLLNGGPVGKGEVSYCLVLGGANGYTVTRSLRDALLLAARRAAAETDDDRLAPGQDVALRGLTARPELNGQRGLVEFFDKPQARWAVRLRGSGDVKLLKAGNLEPAPGAPRAQVWAFDGHAAWNRAQLLGEIAKGHWGLCRCLPATDLLAAPDERRALMDGRLALAPVGPMTDDYGRATAQAAHGAALNRLTDEARQAAHDAQATATAGDAHQAPADAVAVAAVVVAAAAAAAAAGDAHQAPANAAAAADAHHSRDDAPPAHGAPSIAPAHAHVATDAADADATP